MAASSSKTYVKDYSLPQVPSTSQISPSQFPSPRLASYQMERKVKRENVVPRYIFDTPKKMKADPNYVLREIFETHMAEEYTEEARNFILSQLFHKRNTTWEPKDKDFALKLFYKSPACYNFMISAGLRLPSENTIYRWHSEIRLPTGLSEKIKDLLRAKSKTMAKMDRKCVLLFDEMVIKKELEYNVKDDIIYGYTDFGEFGRHKTIASKVMVFTLRGLNKNWKQTIAYYIGNPNGVILSRMIVTIITGVIKCGMTVVATSCDQGASNGRAYSMLKHKRVIETEPYVEIEKHRVFLLYDYPHLFKSVRNILLSHIITIGNDVVDWRILERIAEQDAKGIFQTMFKLTQTHIRPGPFDKFSVKLATQVFSLSVSTAIDHAIKIGFFKTDAEKKVAESTARFIQGMNNLFDALNTGQLYSRNPNKQVLSEATDTLDALKSAREWISTWKSSSTHTIPPCFKGLKQTLLGIEQMWDYHKSDEQSYFLLQHLNTDVAENLFSMMRSSRGSYEQNPSAWRFIRNLKLIIFQHMTAAEHSGYEDAGAEPLLQRVEHEAETENQKIHKEYLFEEKAEKNLFSVCTREHLEADDVNVDLEATKEDPNIGIKLQKAAAAYYSGFAAAKLKKKLNCEICSQFMIDKDNKVREETLLIELRAYKTASTSSEFGKLTVPSIRFEETVSVFQKMFLEHFLKKQTTDRITDNWTMEIMQEKERIGLPSCSRQHQEKIVKFLLIGLIILQLRKSNRQLKDNPKDTVIDIRCDY